MLETWSDQVACTFSSLGPMPVNAGHGDELYGINPGNDVCDNRTEGASPPSAGGHWNLLAMKLTMFLLCLI